MVEGGNTEDVQWQWIYWYVRCDFGLKRAAK